MANKNKDKTPDKGKGRAREGFSARAVQDPDEIRSPASTYGETAVTGDSLPATPHGPNGHGLGLVPADKKAVRDHGTRRQANSKLGRAQPAKQYVAEAATAEAKGHGEGPANFVVTGGDSHGHDPFTSPGRGEHQHGKTASADSIDTIGPNGLNGVPLLEDAFLAMGIREETPDESVVHDDATETIRDDRAGQEISAENAQALLPPKACVFVANLASARTDEELLVSVTEVFETFGRVYIKIRRDTRGMPYAFCQYEDEQHARNAIVGGRRQLIDGRPCRTEPARVNRSVYMSRLTGGGIEEDEARNALSLFGPIEVCWVSSNTEREMYQLPEGIWAKFRYFQDCRDAQMAFRNNDQYRLEQPVHATDAEHRRSLLRPQPHRPVATVRSRLGRPRDDPRPLLQGRQAGTRRSIYVGSLPETATEVQLRRLCEEYGQVVDVDLIVKSSINRSGYTAFAFVRYAYEDDASRAIHRLNKSMFNGRSIRVEPKESVGILPARAGHNFGQVFAKLQRVSQTPGPAVAGPSSGPASTNVPAPSIGGPGPATGNSRHVQHHVAVHESNGNRQVLENPAPVAQVAPQSAGTFYPSGNPEYVHGHGHAANMAGPAPVQPGPVPTFNHGPYAAPQPNYYMPGPTSSAGMPSTAVQPQGNNGADAYSSYYQYQASQQVPYPGYYHMGYMPYTVPYPPVNGATSSAMPAAQAGPSVEAQEFENSSVGQGQETHGPVVPQV